MKPIPVVFHLGPLQIHTYGIGLALTFWFGLRYTERRLRRAGYPWQWVTGMFVWVIVAVMMVMIYGRDGTHCTPPSPFMRIFNNSESELRIAVVLSSRIFLYDSSVRTSL